MPATRYGEAALDRRREKLEYAASFPGLLRDWAEAAGKTVAAVAGAGESRVIVFTDGSLLVARPGPASGNELLDAIESAREALAPYRADALRELDERAAAEREAVRLARMERILGAVETNLPRVPELREELRKLLADGG